MWSSVASWTAFSLYARVCLGPVSQVMLPKRSHRGCCSTWKSVSDGEANERNAAGRWWNETWEVADGGGKMVSAGRTCAERASGRIKDRSNTCNKHEAHLQLCGTACTSACSHWLGVITQSGHNHIFSVFKWMLRDQGQASTRSTLNQTKKKAVEKFFTRTLSFFPWVVWNQIKKEKKKKIPGYCGSLHMWDIMATACLKPRAQWHCRYSIRLNNSSAWSNRKARGTSDIYLCLTDLQQTHADTRIVSPSLRCSVFDSLVLHLQNGAILLQKQI